MATTYYNQEDLRALFQSTFNINEWYLFLQRFFHVKELRATPEKFTEDGAKEDGYYLGRIDTEDNYRIGLFQYNITEGSVVNRRVGIRNLVKSFINPRWGEFDAVLAVFDSSDHWRLSFICDIKGENTAAKRYTYVFGSDELLYKTPIERFNILQKKGVSFENLKTAFSVEALSDEFFDKYREQYANFIQYVTGKRFVKSGSKWEERQLTEPNADFMNAFGNDEKKIRDYIKKMMGRITFLHFLQRKGWMNSDLNYMRNMFDRSEYQDDYLDAVLEPLFFGILNTKPEDRESLFSENGWDKSLLEEWNGIPYLNGGLFECDESDKPKSVFPKDYFNRLFQFFSEYNFTIDENDPNDAEVGVDPEMLGKIFENLLEDNKDKGAFYTPKEIVRYMCQESLIAYLNTKTSIASEKIRRFVLSPEEGVIDIPENKKSKLQVTLEEVKICDPAIGSGAFPMGLLNELLHCREVLAGEKYNRADIKKSIIKNNIYGVDIEKGAVDIARLRFWLSIVVDEDIPSPLPNLDYKIMQGNSLIESFLGVDLSKLTYNSQNGNDIKQLSIFDKAKDIQQRQVSDYLNQYYSCSDHEQKRTLQSKIAEAINNQLEVQKIDNDILIQLKQIDPAANSQFFLWHTWFSDVFNTPSGCNGFDIVIGNPPYLRIQEIRKSNNALAEILSKQYESAVGSFDLYVTFVEKALHIVKTNGVISYIMPVKWTNSTFGKGLRELLLKRSFASSIINFGAYQVFDASTYTGIQMFQYANTLKYLELDRDLKNNLELDSFLRALTSDDFVDIKLSNSEAWVLTNKAVHYVLEKLNKCPLRLSDVFEKIFQGIATSKDDVYFLYNCCSIDANTIEGESKYLHRRITIEKGLVKPLLKGEDVHRYEHLHSDRYVIFPYELKSDNAKLYTETQIKTLFPKGYNYLKECESELRGREKGRLQKDNFWYRYIYPKSLTLFQKEKLVAPEISLGGNFSYDTNGQYYSTTTIYGYIRSKNNHVSYETLLAIMNSSLCWWFLKNTGTVLANGYFRYKPTYLKPFPLPSISHEEDMEIKGLVEMLQQESNKSIRNNIENNINQHIYDLYGLNKNDVSIITS